MAKSRKRKSKSRNPRSYRRDDSHHNAIGNVSGFFTGLLVVTLSLAGAAGVIFGGVATVFAITHQRNAEFCGDGNPSWGCKEGDKEDGIIMGVILLGAGAISIGSAKAIMSDYNN